MYNQNIKNKKRTLLVLNKLFCFYFWNTIECGPLKLFSLIVNWKFLLKFIAFDYIFLKRILIACL